MTSIASVSQQQLTNRRKQLQRARRIRTFQALWRSVLVGGMASSLVWAITLPDWVIRKPEQVAIEGNHLLSAKTIRALLPLSYPQSLLRVEPQELAKSLESEAPIAKATVSRQLMPPGLTIQVQERKPVAIAQVSNTQTMNTSNATSTEGLLDEQGVFLPRNSYRLLDEKHQLPTLKVIGSTEQYRPYWSDVYQAVSHSPVKVLEIDWGNPANLILKTELGIVHIGPYSPRFTEQLAVLDRMREFPSHIQPSKVDYIDLKNPDFPAIQMIKENEIPQPKPH